jgi:hypothetical protein
MDDEREKRIEERRQERDERRRERWERRRHDPIGPVVGALVLIWLGVVLLAAQNSELLRLGPFSVTWINWWAFFAAGAGALLILQGLLRAVTGYGHGITGLLIWGVVLLLVGATGIFPGMNLEQLWPLALIALGLGLLLTNVLRRS